MSEKIEYTYEYLGKKYQLNEDQAQQKNFALALNRRPERYVKIEEPKKKSKNDKP